VVGVGAGVPAGAGAAGLGGGAHLCRVGKPVEAAAARVLTGVGKGAALPVCGGGVAGEGVKGGWVGGWVGESGRIGVRSWRSWAGLVNGAE